MKPALAIIHAAILLASSYAIAGEWAGVTVLVLSNLAANFFVLVYAVACIVLQELKRRSSRAELESRHDEIDVLATMLAICVSSLLILHFANDAYAGPLAAANAMLGFIALLLRRGMAKQPAKRAS